MTNGPRIRFAALGAVLVLRDGAEVELGGGRRSQLLLALLIARADRTVALSEVIDLLWGTEPPGNAVNMVRRHVGMIRRTLEPGLPFRAEGRWLTGVPGGYRLRTDPTTCDVLEFRALVDRATAAATPRQAIPHWIAALRLWRGPYAEGLAATSATFAAIGRQRAAAAAHAADTARRAGTGTDVVLALVQAVAEQNPLDEALAAEVMLLLAANGQPDEATAWYRRISGILADQLGVSPGPVLTAAVERLTGGEPRPAAKAPAQLPPDLWLFTGREADLDALASAHEAFPGLALIAVDGIPGVGKSTLAVHWSHTVAHRYPDGQLFVNLRGYAPSGEPADPGTVLAGFLGALDVPQEQIPADLEARAAHFRTLTAHRRLLIVMDNAVGVDQVRPLIPAGAGCLVLITSRTRLSSLAAREGAALISLDLPGLAESREHLRRRLPVRRPAARDEDLDEIAAYCGRLPLAISIVAARTQGSAGGMAELLEELRESRDSLDAFDDDSLGGVRAVFSWSYRRLNPAAARLFRLLPTHTGPDATVAQLASLAGLPRSTLRPLIRELVQTRLVSESRPGRYAQHDLIAVYAAELAADLDSATEQEVAADRLLDHFTRSIQQINAGILAPFMQRIEGVPLAGVVPETFDDLTAAEDWFRAESGNLAAALHEAQRRGRNPWPTLVDSFVMHLRTSRLAQWADRARPSLAAAMEAGDRLAEAHLRELLANVASLHGQEGEASVEYLHARALFESLGARAEQGIVELKLAEFTTGETEPDYARGIPFYDRAVALFRETGHERGLRMASLMLGRCQLELGLTAQGMTTLAEALHGCLRDGDQQAAGFVLMHIGAAAHRPDAADFLLVAQRLFGEVGNRYQALNAGQLLALEYLRTGRRLDAGVVWRRAADLQARMSADGAYLAEEVQIRSARLTALLGPPTAANEP